MVSKIEKTVEKIEAAATEGGKLTISVNIPSAELFALADSWRRLAAALKEQPLASKIEEIVETIETEGVGRYEGRPGLFAIELGALTQSWRWQREALQGLLYEWNRTTGLTTLVTGSRNIDKAIKALEE